MIELPEALTIGRQADEALTGKRIALVNQGNSPHAWAWYSGSSAEYEERLVGQRVEGAGGALKFVCLRMSNGYELTVGDMGGRILYHADESSLPAKRHLLVGFEDGSYLSVAIQGWGGMFLWSREEAAAQRAKAGIDPLSPELTVARLAALMAEYDENGKASAKAFLVQHPPVGGIGNGCLQDILFHARIHPTRKLSTLGKAEVKALHSAVRATLRAMVDGGGRDTERDLHGAPGGHTPLLDKRALGRPCPACGAAIEKRAYLGGAIYYCARCQA